MKINNKAQSTVEYAIVIGVVVAALVAMQTYVKRGLQARYHDGIQFMVDETNKGQDGGSGIGNTLQYEPYYLDSDYTSTSNKNENESIGVRGQVTRNLTQEIRTRAAGGSERVLAPASNTESVSELTVTAE